MYDIITIGSATRDVFMESKAMHPHKAPDVITHIEACFPFGAKINVESIFFTTGGGATNNAATFSQLGKLRTAALCRIGDDSAGAEILEGLKKENVNTAFVQKTKNHKEHTAYSTILSPGGDASERTILVYRGASKKFEHNKIPWKKLKTKWFYISSLGGDLVLLKKILAHAKKIKAKVVFNPGGQELKKAKQAKNLFKQLTFLILNREEAAKLTGKKFSNTKTLLQALASWAPSVVMTDGPKGAYAVVRPKTENRKPKNLIASSLNRLIALHVPSVGHKARNRTGAGDAFGSGFVTGWIKNKGDIKEALRVASFNADSVVQKIGAKGGILSKYPSQKQLSKLAVKKLKL